MCECDWCVSVCVCECDSVCVCVCVCLLSTVHAELYVVFVRGIKLLSCNFHIVANSFCDFCLCIRVFHFQICTPCRQAVGY